MKPKKRLLDGKAAKTELRGFYDLAKAHVAMQGGVWLVIDSKNPAQAQQRRAWLAYFAWLDDQTVPKGGKAATFRKLEKLTVPTEWPLEFDASAPPVAPPEPKEEPTRNRRREIGAMLHGLVASLAMPDAPGPTNWRDMTPPQAEDQLAKRAATYAKARPLVSTSGMAKYLEGMRQPEELDDAIDF